MNLVSLSTGAAEALANQMLEELFENNGIAVDDDMRNGLTTFLDAGVTHVLMEAVKLIEATLKSMEE